MVQEWGAVDNKQCLQYTVQTLNNGTSSKYDNMLLIHSTIDDILGEYMCIINNTIGQAEDTISLTG